MDKQVSREHYNFTKYSHVDRWVSYYHQLDEVLELKPTSILEIGVGDKVFGSYIKNNTNVEYKSVDIALDLQPDIFGPVTLLPVPDYSYDVVCAFEVLEHLLFEEFTIALEELKRVSRNYIIISLPHFGPPLQFLLKIPLLPKITFALKIPYYKSHKFNGEHYWEIGKKGYPLRTILSTLEKYGKVTKHFVPFESQYHHFFIIKI